MKNFIYEEEITFFDKGFFKTMTHICMTANAMMVTQFVVPLKTKKNTKE
jgi:hypothetical protein